MGTERERHESVVGDGDKRGLVLEGIWPMWGDRCFCVEGRGEHTHTVASAVVMPPWDEQTDVWSGCTGIPRLSEHTQTTSDNVFSSPFHRSSTSSPPYFLITGRSHGSSTYDDVSSQQLSIKITKDHKLTVMKTFDRMCLKHKIYKYQIFIIADNYMWL